MKRSPVVALLLPILFLELARPALAAAGSAAPTGATQSRNFDPAATRGPRVNDAVSPHELPGGLRPRRSVPPHELPGGLRPHRSVPPHELPGGLRPHRSEPGGEAPGADRSRRFVYDAPNGIQIVVHGHRPGSSAFVGRATLAAPGGESMIFDLADGGRFGPSVLIDNEILVGYRLSRSGQVTSVTFDDGTRTVRSARGGRSHGESHAAYLALAGALAERHSPEFLREIDVALRSMHRDRAVPAQAREWIECALGITGYVVSIWGIFGGCVVAGVPTLGASCILAILAHEAAVASAILSCFP